MIKFDFYRFIANYHRLPERVRLVLTAILGSTIGWVTYEILYGLNPFGQHRATTSWTLSFLIGVPRQHALHHLLTFVHKAPYWRSLGKAYVFYSMSALAGFWIIYYLTAIFSINHRLAWIFCLAMSGLINLYLLKRSVFLAEDASKTNLM